MVNDANWPYITARNDAAFSKHGLRLLCQDVESIEYGTRMPNPWIDLDHPIMDEQHNQPPVVVEFVAHSGRPDYSALPLS